MSGLIPFLHIKQQDNNLIHNIYYYPLAQGWKKKESWCSDVKCNMKAIKITKVIELLILLAQGEVKCQS